MYIKIYEIYMYIYIKKTYLYIVNINTFNKISLSDAGGGERRKTNKV